MGREQNSFTFCYHFEKNLHKNLSKQQDFIGAFIKEFKKSFFKKVMKRKNSHVFLLKKVGGALIRGGALNRDYTVLICNIEFANT